MKLSEETKAFIKAHQQEDVTALLLRAGKYPEVDIPFVAEQIIARKQIKDKLPSWYVNDSLIFPSKISAEQCSSESTAGYKQRLISQGAVLCDLTGGLGIDSYFFSLKAGSVTYIERFKAYCEAVHNNFEVLAANNIRILEGDTMNYIHTLSNVDVFYIDPARRAEGNKRVFALQDCEPDLLQIKSLLLEKAPKVIAKISPMADVQHTLSLLPETTEVHVLSVKNECKELLFVLERGKGLSEPVVTCINVTADGTEQSFCFTLSEEKEAVSVFAPVLKQYLYEPNASVLKAGAFKSIALKKGLHKLHKSSHLYTSDTELKDFPGRIFKVEEVIKFGGKSCNALSRLIPKANITVRNFPLTVEELRKRTKITDGGEVYLFATTIGKEDKVLINCRKI